MTNISSFIKYNRKRLKITQEELANKAGVGIRFVRELEQGKKTLQLDKANQVLSLFGFILAPVKQEIDPYMVALNFNNNGSKYLRKAVKIILKNMIPFFDGLIPEGWLLEIAVENWKLNPRDRMNLLLTLCQDNIGDVSIKREIK